MAKNGVFNDLDNNDKTVMEYLIIMLQQIATIKFFITPSLY